MRRWARLSGAAVLLVYLASFVLPVIDNSEAQFNHMSPAPRGVVLGWHAFLTGWFWPVGWAANPALWAGLILLMVGRPRAAGVVGAVAVGLGLSYLYLLLDRSLVWQRRFQVGYFAWLASMALLAAAGFGLRWVGPARRGGGAGAEANGGAGR